MNALCIHAVYVLCVFCTKANSEDSVHEHSKYSFYIYFFIILFS